MTLKIENYKIILIITLLFSAIIVSIQSRLISPRSAPDERHHYAYAKYVSENFLPFPPELANTYTDKDGEYNHLSHPPLYYYLMAISLKIVNFNKDFTEIGRDVDKYGRLSSATGIEILRSISIFLYFIHQLGIYLLLIHLNDKKVITKSLSIYLCALISFVPGFLYIAGTLNNDALSMALWPFLVLYTSKFYFETKFKYYCTILSISSLAFLTKATLWPLVAFIITFSSVYFFYSIISFYKSDKLTEIAYPLRNNMVFLFFALLFIFPSILYINYKIRTYDNIHVAYIDRYQLQREDSKFFKMTDDFTKKSFYEVAQMSKIAFRSLIGVMGGTERLYKVNWDKQFSIFLYGFFLLFVYSIIFLNIQLFQNKKNLLLLFLVIVSLTFTFYFTYRSYDVYNRSAYFGAQGRYFIGYLEILLIGVCGLAWRAYMNVMRFNQAIKTFIYIIFSALFFVFFSPFFFISNSKEFFNKTNVYQIVIDNLQNDGFQKLDNTYFSPNRLETRGYIKNPLNGMPSHYQFAWINSTIGGILKTENINCFKVSVLSLGNTAYFKKAIIGIGIVNNNTQPTIDDVLQIFKISDNFSLTQTEIIIPDHIMEDPLFFVRGLNSHDELNTFLYDIWPNFRLIRIFDIYYKPIACTTP